MLRSVGKERLYPAYWPKKWKSCRGENQGSHPDEKSKKEKMIYNEPTNKGEDPTIREGESVGFCLMLVGY